MNSLLARSSSGNVSLSANIASVGSLDIFGYTGAGNVVIAEGSRIYAQTNSDDKGYFSFNNIPLSQSSTEVCLTAVDAKDRTSFPTCLPVAGNPDTVLGPILLPPTLSLVKNKTFPGQIVSASGQTIPSADVRVVISKKSGQNLNLVSNVYAYNLPNYTIKTDQKGNFSFNLPNSALTKYRIFALAEYNNSPSPKSQTLTFSRGAPLIWFILIFLVVWIIALILTHFILKNKKSYLQKLYLQFEAYFARLLLSRS